jgi:hypothetical protein
MRPAVRAVGGACVWFGVGRGWLLRLNREDEREGVRGRRYAAPGVVHVKFE